MVREEGLEVRYGIENMDLRACRLYSRNSSLHGVYIRSILQLIVLPA
jgi:hypothetical protein